MIRSAFCDRPGRRLLNRQQRPGQSQTSSLSLEPLEGRFMLSVGRPDLGSSVREITVMPRNPFLGIDIFPVVEGFSFGTVED